MFGKPEWFGEKRVAWQLKPVCWQGWAYAVVWLGVLALPIFCLLATSRVTEALIWLVVAGGAMLWDTRQIVHANDSKAIDEDVLYITADDDDAPLGTQKYEFEVRR
jgi:hypothetical protein